jgi:aminoglycoside phosphotransferase (APT) family kinase protein
VFSQHLDSFRFNRGFRDDVYESESANYRMVAAATGVRVPEIVAIDRSRDLLPTSYMVMEYLTGQDWTALCAADNPATSSRQKRDIRRAAGAVGNRLADVSGHAVPGRRLWARDTPVSVVPEAIDRDPFFQAYAESADLDARALSRLALSTQLSTWGMIAAEGAPPEKKRWIREQKLPLINDLIQLISRS